MDVEARPLDLGRIASVHVHGGLKFIEAPVPVIEDVGTVSAAKELEVAVPYRILPFQPGHVEIELIEELDRPALVRRGNPQSAPRTIVKGRHSCRCRYRLLL